MTDLRPLFEEPSSAIERGHPDEGPYGFLVGGGATLTFHELAGQYLQAADALVDLIKRREIADYELANPIIYLYRHAIELSLKALLPGARGHDLVSLTCRLEAVLRDRSHTVIPTWIVTRISEMARTDPDSATFRYNQNRSVIAAGEFHVDLLHLQSTVNALCVGLNALAAANKQ